MKNIKLYLGYKVTLDWSVKNISKANIWAETQVRRSYLCDDWVKEENFL